MLTEPARTIWRGGGASGCTSPRFIKSGRCAAGSWSATADGRGPRSSGPRRMIPREGWTDRLLSRSAGELPDRSSSNPDRQDVVVAQESYSQQLQQCCIPGLRATGGTFPRHSSATWPYSSCQPPSVVQVAWAGFRLPIGGVFWWCPGIVWGCRIAVVLVVSDVPPGLVADVSLTSGSVCEVQFAVAYGSKCCGQCGVRYRVGAVVCRCCLRD